MVVFCMSIIIYLFIGCQLQYTYCPQDGELYPPGAGLEKTMDACTLKCYITLYLYIVILLAHLRIRQKPFHCTWCFYDGACDK